MKHFSTNMNTNCGPIPVQNGHSTCFEGLALTQPPAMKKAPSMGLLLLGHGVPEGVHSVRLFYWL
jgi:hypothetical protein